MKHAILLFFFTLFAISHAYDYKSECECPSYNGIYPDPSYTYQMKTSFQKSDTNEYINGIQWGKFLSFGGKVWLSKDVKPSISASTIRAVCPPGFRIPTGNELRSFMEAVNASYPGTQADFLINKFGLDSTFYYGTSEKQFPNNNSTDDDDAWRYLVLDFLNGVPRLESPSLRLLGNSLRIRCILYSSVPLVSEIVGLPEKLTKGVSYTVSYKRTGVTANFWRVNGQNFGNSPNFNWVPDRAGCHAVESFLVWWSGIIIRNCQIVWANLQFGSSKNTVLNVQTIKSKVYSDFDVNLANYMHFGPSNAPIAPRADGGAYVLFATRDSKDLYVRVIDNEGNDLRSPISLNRKGYPFDIVATPWGFVSLIKDGANSNYLYLLGNYEDGSLKFDRTIMHNEYRPLFAQPDQLIFYDPPGVPATGMRAMYSPHNGRIAFFKGRIAITFAHYTLVSTIPVLEYHTGCTQVVFDESGQDERLVTSWGTSHCLIQNIETTESSIIIGELGDAIPQSVRVVSFGIDVDPFQVDFVSGKQNRIPFIGYNNLISGNYPIPGDRGGASCGTLGAINYIGDNILAMTYQRKACSVLGFTNDKNEVGIVFFFSNLTKINEVALADGTSVNVVKSAKYGANIVVAMGVSSISGPYPTRHCIPESDVMKIMLVSPQGIILSQETVVTPYSLTADDDFEVLSDGSVVWSFINSDNKFVLYKLPINQSTVLLQHKLKHKSKKSKILVDKIEI